MNKKQLIDNLQILGLLAAIIYVSLILITWIAFRYDGYTYFIAGDNNFIVVILEWCLAIFAIWSLSKTIIQLINAYKLKYNGGF